MRRRPLPLPAPLLTVVSLAAGRRTLHYDDLLPQLDLDSVRQLEDVLISDCVYSGLIRGRLDQRQRCLLVEDAFARDVSPEALPEVAAALRAWLGAVRGVLAAVDARMAWTAEAEAAGAPRRAAFKRKRCSS